MALGVGSVIELTYRSTLFGQTILNVFHYECTTASSTANPITEVEDFLNIFTTPGAATFLGKYGACLPANLTIIGAVAQAIAPTRYRRVTAPINVIGARGNAAVANTAGVITLSSVFSGRKEIGSKHLVAANNDFASGIITDAYKTVLTAFADVLDQVVLAAVGGGAYTPCIYHRNEPLTTNTSTIFATEVQLTSRVMRRRTVGLGI